jgi:uncharacterized protein YkwD
MDMRRIHLAPLVAVSALSVLATATPAPAGARQNAPTVIVVTSMLPGMIATSQRAKTTRMVVTVTPLANCKPAKTYASADADTEAEILRRINAERASRSLKPLVLAPALVQAARRHATDMAARDFMDHEGSDKSDYRIRIDAACYAWARIGENIGAGYGGDPQKVVKGWMGSPPHRAAILSREFTEAGVGYAVNDKSAMGHFWTVNFGVPRGALPALPTASATATPRP